MFHFLCMTILLSNAQTYGQQELSPIWSSYLAENNKSISAVNKLITTTYGIKEYAFIKSLTLNQNGLREIGEIKYLINLEYLDLNGNFLEFTEDLKN